MSRRIVLFALAASAALIITPALADLECFENSCRLPGAVEMPAQPEAATQPETRAAAEEQQPEPIRAIAGAQKPAAAVVSPEEVARAKTGRSVTAIAPASTELRTEQDARNSVDAVRVAPRGYARGDRNADYGLNPGEAPTGALIVAAPSVLYPFARPDPAWRGCQVDQRAQGVVYCSPESYHPYGPYGYRPNGTYAAYRSPPIIAVAPNAKIIAIDSAD